MLRSLLVLLTFALVLGCGTESPPPTGRAIDALPDVGPTIVRDEDLGPDDLILNRLEVVIRAEATPSGLGEALDAIGGSLAAARPGLPYVTVTFPPAVDLAGVEAQAAILEAHPDVLYAGPAYLVSAPITFDSTDGSRALVPPGGGGVENPYLGEQRFFGAWNADALATHRTTVVVADFFTRLEPLPQLSVQRFIGASVVDESTMPPRGSRSFPGNHGFWVTSILAADADGLAPVGSHPDPATTLDVASLQMLRIGCLLDTVLYMDRHLPTDAPFILNTSFGFGNALEDSRSITALAWREVLLRRAPFLHLTSSGNDGLMPEIARPDSAFTLQASTDDLLSWMPMVFQAEFLPVWREAEARLGARARTRAGVTLIVGSSTTAGAESDFSNRGADIRMTGEFMVGVCDRPEPLGSCAASGLMDADGTSASSPLAAGLAAWLFSIDPTLTPDELSDLMLFADDGRWVDALTATLALESRGIPVRRALLDIQRNGAFDDADLTSFLSSFDVEEAAHPVASLEDRTWTRADVNGDGHPRSDTGAPFDLDADGTLTTIDIMVPGDEGAGEETRSLDERSLTDLEVLCWAVAAGPYTGAATAGETFLRDRCQPDVAPLGAVTFLRTQMSTGEPGCIPGMDRVEVIADVQISPTGEVLALTGTYRNESRTEGRPLVGFCAQVLIATGTLEREIVTGTGTLRARISETFPGFGALSVPVRYTSTNTRSGAVECAGEEVLVDELLTIDLMFARTPEGHYDFTRDEPGRILVCSDEHFIQTGVIIAR